MYDCSLMETPEALHYNNSNGIYRMLFKNTLRFICLLLFAVRGEDQVSIRVSAKHRTEEETAGGKRRLSQRGAGQT